MTSAGWCFGKSLTSNMEEKALLVDSFGMGIVTDIGRCIEKKEDI